MCVWFKLNLWLASVCICPCLFSSPDVLGMLVHRIYNGSVGRGWGYINDVARLWRKPGVKSVLDAPQRFNS